jgi:hypothetical protein
VLATGRRYYAQQQHLSALAVRQLRGTSDITEVLRLLAVYQSTAALLAMENGTAALHEQGLNPAGAEVIPTAFTVIPSAPSVLDDIERGPQFDRIVATLVNDAGRSAMGAFTTSRTREYGNIRVLTPPSCSRCAILAGRFYRWSEGFQRHPRCDCTMTPGTSSAALPDPNGAFERGEITDLTQAQTQAINDGADISQVVNSRRGMSTANFAGRRVQITTEGTTSRGLAFSQLSQRGGTATVDAGFATRITTDGPEQRRITQTIARAPRLSPEAIYNVSAGNRDTAIRCSAPTATSSSNHGPKWLPEAVRLRRAADGRPKLAA